MASWMGGDGVGWVLRTRLIYRKGESVMATTNHLIRGFMALVAMMAIALLAGLMSHHDPAWAQVDTEAVPGTTITVNTKEDETTPNDGKCSLREAIQNANDNAQTSPDCKAGSATEEDAIHFSLGRKATIVLGSTLPTITDPSGLNINGQKAKITISGNGAVRVFVVGVGAKLTVAKLAVAHGVAVGRSGGAILNEGTLMVIDSTFSANSARIGGGIYNGPPGTLTVTNSTFSANGALSGGGIYNDGTLTMTNSTFSANSAGFGGGIYNSTGTLTMTNSTFSANSATVGDSAPGGGAIFNAGGTSTLSNTIVANSPSGGNCSGTITDGGYNIEDGTTCGFSAANNSMPSTDPLLDPKGLQNNGGPTQTISC